MSKGKNTNEGGFIYLFRLGMHVFIAICLPAIFLVE